MKYKVAYDTVSKNNDDKSIAVIEFIYVNQAIFAATYNK